MRRRVNFFTPGKTIRFHRLFHTRSKRMVAVAMDHGLGGLRPGLETPERTLREIIEAEPDAVLLTPGMAQRFHQLFVGKHAPSLILSLDFVIFAEEGARSHVVEQRLMNSVEEAVRLGADAIKLLLVMGSTPTLQANNMTYLTVCAEDCSRWGMPLMIEPTLWGAQVPDNEAVRAARVADGARIAVEMGADLIKVDYLGDAFKRVLESSPVPVTILGGQKAVDEKAMLAQVSEAVEAGAAGVVFGRNVWQHPQPPRMIGALKHVIHENDMQAAWSELGL
jgi:fructose-bisphosphate aldolase, class I